MVLLVTIPSVNSSNLAWYVTFTCINIHV